mgnify:FL=1
MKRYSGRDIARTLRKYDTTTVDVDVDTRTPLSMVGSEDPLKLLDRLIETEEAGGGGKTTRFPYWAEIWPAAVALSRWFAASAQPPERALELGCGLGLVGIADRKSVV